MNTDMSVSMGTQPPMYTDISMFIGDSCLGNIYKVSLHNDHVN